MDDDILKGIRRIRPQAEIGLEGDFPVGGALPGVFSGKVKLIPEDGGVRYDNDLVNAWLSAGDGGASIHEFSSVQPGRGNAALALKDMKQRWPDLTVIDPGQPGSDSRNFWEKMFLRGLVSRLEDE